MSSFFFSPFETNHWDEAERLRDEVLNYQSLDRKSFVVLAKSLSREQQAYLRRRLVENSGRARMLCVVKQGPVQGAYRIEPLCEGDEPPIYNLSREGLKYAILMGWRWVTPPFQPHVSEVAFREIVARGWLRESSDERDTPSAHKKERKEQSR